MPHAPLQLRLFGAALAATVGMLIAIAAVFLGQPTIRMDWALAAAAVGFVLPIFTVRCLRTCLD